MLWHEPVLDQYQWWARWIILFGEKKVSTVSRQATINKVLRISCTAPGSLMHVAMEDIHVNGYTLPKVFINHHHCNIWCNWMTYMGGVPFTLYSVQCTKEVVIQYNCYTFWLLTHMDYNDLQYNVDGWPFCQGTGIAANFMATHMDPELWQDPEQFHPERFGKTS